VKGLPNFEIQPIVGMASDDAALSFHRDVASVEGRQAEVGTDVIPWSEDVHPSKLVQPPCCHVDHVLDGLRKEDAWKEE
jgi:hypothetical protein